MGLTADQTFLLNNQMGKAASDVRLGDLLASAFTITPGELTLASAKILVGNASNVGAAVSLSGDATIANTGALTIAASAITNTKVSASAAIDFSKLATLTSGNILVGSAGNVATSVAMSGDATIIASGALTIAAGAVTFSKLDPSVGQYTASVALTQAQIQGLSVTPIQLIAAPGAGKLIVVDEVEFLHTYSTAVYANGGKLQVQYHGSTDILDAAVGTVTAGSSASFIARPNVYDVDNTTGSAMQNMTSLAALAVDLTNATAPFINGNASNVLKLRVKYRVITLLT